MHKIMYDIAIELEMDLIMIILIPFKQYTDKSLPIHNFSRTHLQISAYQAPIQAKHQQNQEKTGYQCLLQEFQKQMYNSRIQQPSLNSKRLK